MDEREVRYPAGPNGDGTIHRVGLTRHCLASGRVQLPFALRDTFPEGELLAIDAGSDEPIVLASVPPRQLGGLSEFFRAHDLQVNDQLEIRVSGDEAHQVRIAPLRRPRSQDRPQDGPDDATAEGQEGGPAVSKARRQVSTWYSVRDDPAPARSRPWSATQAGAPDQLESDGLDLDAIEGETTLAQLADRAGESPPQPEAGTSEEAPNVEAQPAAAGPDVVERIGSVTVRRLGTDLKSGAPVMRLAQPAAETAVSTPATPVEPTPADEPVASLPSTEAADQEPVLGVDPETRLEWSQRESDDVLQLPLFGAPDEKPPASRTSGPKVEPPRKAPPPRPTPGRAPIARRAGPAGLGPTPDPAGNDTRPAQPAENPAPTPAPTPAPAGSSTEQPLSEQDRRDREEELSRAGDLRSRIIRWLLEPSTPVIVPLERVQDTFELPADVARDIVDGVLESPPPSLRLTRVREDLLRVSRITVEQNA